MSYENSNKTEKRIQEFSMSGTLGDAFIVFCKLFRYYKQTGKKIRLYRYSLFPKFDNALSQFFKGISFVEYVTPSIQINSLFSREKNWRGFQGLYVNSGVSNSGHGIFPDDPEGIKMEPYPEFGLSGKKMGGEKFRVGIQLHSGKLESNFKGFSLRWIKKIRKLIPKEDFDIFLFGLGDGYNVNKIETFCRNNDIKNCVGKINFIEWLKYIKAMNFFITPEGFPAFFAMSQRIRSLVFYTDYQILRRIHPNWRKENIIISAGWKNFRMRVVNFILKKLFGRNKFLSPLNPEQVWSLIYGEHK